jgi:hypothetical protein
MDKITDYIIATKDSPYPFTLIISWTYSWSSDSSHSDLPSC